MVALNLRANNLSGSLPIDEIGDLSELTRLDLSGNRLNGEIPAVLGSLSNLTHLDLSANLLSGGVPAELGDLSNLSRLSLDTNVLSGMLPDGLSRLRLTALEMDTATGLYRSAQSGPTGNLADRPGHHPALVSVRYRVL